MTQLRVLLNSLAYLLLSGFLSASQAQISQTPLLTQSGSVEPNLMLMFDDSKSMLAQFMYQYGGEEGGYGRGGPGAGTGATSGCLRAIEGTVCCRLVTESPHVRN